MMTRVLRQGYAFNRAHKTKSDDEVRAPLMLPAAASVLNFTVPSGQHQLFLTEYGIASMERLQRTMHTTNKGAVIRPLAPLYV